jgi:hypothetical protein
MAENDFTLKPDPSSATATTILREIASLKELFETKFEGYDKAIVLLQDIANRSPTINEVYLQHEERFKVIDEKFETVNVRFDGVEKQFIERDVRTEKTERDSKTAIDAALAGQEKAAGKLNESSSQAILKQEASFSKQIDQLGDLIKTVIKGMDGKFDDIKERVTRVETQDKTIDKSKTDFRLLIGVLVGVVGLIITVVVLVVKP